MKIYLLSIFMKIKVILSLRVNSVIALFNFITIFIVMEISNFIRRALFVVWGIAINLL